MVGLGLLMLALGCGACSPDGAARLYDWPSLHRAALVMGPSGFVAVIAGWITTEVGRQPFTVYGLLRTADSVSPLAAPAVAASLLAFVLVYFAVFGVGTWYILRLMGQPPHPGEHRADGADPHRRDHSAARRRTPADDPPPREEREDAQSTSPSSGPSSSPSRCSRMW